MSEENKKEVSPYIQSTHVEIPEKTTAYMVARVGEYSEEGNDDDMQTTVLIEAGHPDDVAQMLGSGVAALVKMFIDRGGVPADSLDFVIERVLGFATSTLKQNSLLPKTKESK